jgi:hypothetical protein
VTRRVIPSKLALSQIEARREWWRANRGSAPDPFVVELKNALRFLKRFPLGAPIHRMDPHQRARRVLLAKTQYLVFYEYDAQRRIIRLLTIEHTALGGDPDLR